MGSYRTRPVGVDAEQVNMPESLYHGYWIIRIDGGIACFVSPADFAAKYEPIPDESSEGESALPDLAGFARRVGNLMLGDAQPSEDDCFDLAIEHGIVAPTDSGGMTFALHPPLRDEPTQ